jgi:hypothetical protein
MIQTRRAHSSKPPPYLASRGGNSRVPPNKLYGICALRLPVYGDPHPTGCPLIRLIAPIRRHNCASFTPFTCSRVRVRIGGIKATARLTSLAPKGAVHAPGEGVLGAAWVALGGRAVTNAPSTDPRRGEELSAMSALIEPSRDRRNRHLHTNRLRGRKRALCPHLDRVEGIRHS